MTKTSCAMLQAFGKAGSAALGAEAEKMQPGKKRTGPAPLELKAGAARGMFAGPAAGPSRSGFNGSTLSCCF